jgi:hypothetical protein
VVAIAQIALLGIIALQIKRLVQAAAPPNAIGVKLLLKLP